MLKRQQVTEKLAVSLLIGLIAGPASALPGDDGAPVVQEVSDELVPVQVAGPFEFPWSIGFLPDGSVLVTEKPGRLRLVKPGSRTREIRGLPPIRSGNQGGLLDVVVDPDFDRTGTVYLSYTHGTQDASTVRILKARLDLKRRRLVDHTILLESDPPASANEQLGGRLALSRDGYLFLSLGDRWEPTAPRTCPIMPDPLSGSMPMVRSQKRTPSSPSRARSPRSGRTATGTRRVSSATIKPDSYGLPSMAPRVGTNSI